MAILFLVAGFPQCTIGNYPHRISLTRLHPTLRYRVPHMISTAQKTSPVVEYCLYARKSSESDERQAMSIDSQVKEMGALAKKEGLKVKEIRQESCSAKTSGYRPIFNQLLSDLRNGIFNGILTWAPDRLSRNAGDLGMLVDLMDQEKLRQIRTFSQTFSNNPNEKFLLMILCSQAKLENDNRGINVKRGIRAKCEMGWRPGVAGLGYYNRAFGGIKDIVADPERAPLIKEMFERVANFGHSGRTLKVWLDEKGLTNRSGKKVTLSQIYLILKNPFYYGQFQYGETQYKGAHEPLISEELFKRVQKQLVVPRKAKWGSKGFAFKHVFKCATCGSNLVGEEKYKKLTTGLFRKHVYYHCPHPLYSECKEPYISEDEVIKQLVKLIDGLNSNDLKLGEKLEGSLLDYQKIIKEVTRQQESEIDETKVDFKSYAKYVLREGSNKDKQELTDSLKLPLYLQNRNLILRPHSIIQD